MRQTKVYYGIDYLGAGEYGIIAFTREELANEFIIRQNPSYGNLESLETFFDSDIYKQARYNDEMYTSEWAEEDAENENEEDNNLEE